MDTFKISTEYPGQAIYHMDFVKSSNPKKSGVAWYTVVTLHKTLDTACNCKGFLYRGYCRHCDEIREKRYRQTEEMPY